MCSASAIFMRLSDCRQQYNIKVYLFWILFFSVFTLFIVWLNTFREYMSFDKYCSIFSQCYFISLKRE